MPAYVEVRASDDPGDPTVLVEVPAPAGMVDVGRGDRIVVRASESLGAMAERVRPVVEGMVSSFRSATDAPDEIEVTFGVSLSSEADVVVSRAAAEANFQVSLTWRRDDDPGRCISSDPQGADD
ncbi:CU044_2847 family protein [Promicromonospora sp. NPDC023987]|uniref:CU044_2847 family protein n=1 Tax=Promicromonospora sp. NPDC023987 TaxID=3155360 RepID=UPI003400B4AE